MADTKINIKFPLEKSSKGAFETNSSTLEAVESDLKILIMTNHGERVIHWDYGANLRRVLFEQMGGEFSYGTDLRNTPIGQQIVDAIDVAVDRWMPFVIIKNVQIIATGNSNEILLKIKFTVANLNQDERLVELRIRA